MNITFIRRKIRKQEYDFSNHAHQERQEEEITVEEIEQTLLKGDIIETYSNDARGVSCLITGKVADKFFHIVCGMREDRLLIITVYKPKLPTWIDYKTRAKELRSRV